MRQCISILILLALSRAATAQLAYLTVNEIFEAIEFLVAHPGSPADRSKVSPFGPEADDTRMPETFSDLAKNILHCYRDTAHFQDADIVQTPWEQQAQYGGEKSALIRIRYTGVSPSEQYEMRVALVARQDQIRAAVLNDDSPIAWDKACPMENWQTPGK